MKPRELCTVLLLARTMLLVGPVLLVAFPAPLAAQAAPPAEHPLKFINTGFENASPLWYDFADDGTVRVHLLYDHERSSPNRAAGHIHFQIEADPGARLTFEFLNLDNVWNGRPGSVARELRTLVVSENGRDWRPLRTQVLEEKRVRLELEMPGPILYLARVEPYRVSDLNRLLDGIRSHPMVEVTSIGKTVTGQPLEIIQLGNPAAPHRVFLRARAHPWEAGGNWVLEGLIRRLLQNDPAVSEYLKTYCLFILPMANKDGVAHGRTRFNLLGKDLNREWNKPVDARLAPENHALEVWLEKMIKAGQAPQLAMELHNDGNGRLHISRPPVENLEQYLKRMQLLEQLLRKHTWFTEGSTPGSFRNSGTLGDGWLERYGIDALVHEFNCHWIAGLNEPPLARHWKDYGANLATVLHKYFQEIEL